MRLNANHHFDVEGALNGHSTRFILDTGSATTLIDKQVAVRSGTSVTALVGVGAGGAGGLGQGVDRTGVKELAIGNFKIANAEVVVAHVSGDILLSQSASESNAGVLGQEYLSQISRSSTWVAWRFICATPIPAKEKFVAQATAEHGAGRLGFAPALLVNAIKTRLRKTARQVPPVPI
jgi:hypothetical protein